MPCRVLSFCCGSCWPKRVRQLPGVPWQTNRNVCAWQRLPSCLWRLSYSPARRSHRHHWLKLQSKGYRYAAFVGFPFLLARRRGYRFTTLSLTANPSPPTSQYSLLDLFFVATGCSILLALNGLPGIISTSRLEGLTFLVMYSAPVWLMVPAILYPRAAALAFVVPIAVLSCPALPFSLYWLSSSDQFIAAICTAAEGLTLLITTGALRFCGYRLRRTF